MPRTRPLFSIHGEAILKERCFKCHSHERLTFRQNGIDRRLTDVHGRVVKEIVVG